MTKQEIIVRASEMLKKPSARKAFVVLADMLHELNGGSEFEIGEHDIVVAKYASRLASKRGRKASK